ncbi:MAG TPA: hypothetical protein VI007_10810 [bacterium]
MAWNEAAVKGFLIVRFRGKSPEEAAKELWDDGRERAWPKQMDKAARPAATITRITTLKPIRVEEDGHEAFTSFALITANTEADLRRVWEYVEQYFSHVEAYAIGLDMGG